MRKIGNSLYIPINIRRRKEIVDGFGRKEATKTVIATLIGLFVGIVVYFIQNGNVMMLILPPILFLMGAIVIFRKDSFNSNLVDKFKLQINFFRSQKCYYYNYVNIYEREKGE